MFLLYQYISSVIKKSGPSVFILYGPTGVGKTSVSVNLAKDFDAEVVNCDMAQIFSEGKIGTGQIKSNEMEGVPHHLFGFLNNPVKFTVYDMRLALEDAIKRILLKGKSVFLVGGSSFCIFSLFFIPFLFFLLHYKHLNSDYLSADSVFKDTKKDSLDRIIFFPLYEYNIIFLDVLDKKEWRVLLSKRIDSFLCEGLLEEVCCMQKAWRDFLFNKKIIGYFQFIDGLNFCQDFKFDDCEIVRRKELTFFATCQYGKKQRTFMRKMIRDLKSFEVSYCIYNFFD